MKRKIPLVFSVLICGGIFASAMIGEYNTWLGYIAGINAEGNRCTMQGAGAGGEATKLVRTDFIGAAAGAYAYDLTDCVGIGYRALRDAQNMERVVAIGSGAFTNWASLVDSTWLNGQFVALGLHDMFWLKANPNTPDSQAPIHYANGVLTFNVEEVRVNGITTSGGSSGSSGSLGGSTTNSVLAGFDLYVDPVSGNDSYGGTTPRTAKRTIDSALASVTNHGVTICLLAGVHASPTAGSNGDDFAPYKVHYFGAYGKEATIIDGELSRVFWGSSTAFTSVERCTIRNARGRLNRPRFAGLYFYDCAIDISGGSSGYGFFSCVIEKCLISGVPVSHTDSSRLFTGLFVNSDVFDSIVDILPVEISGREISLLRSSYLENVFVRLQGTVKHLGAAIDADKSILGNSIGLKDCTIICEQATSSFDVPPAIGCLFGLGSDTAVPTYATLAGCVCTNAATVAEVVGEGCRPSVTAWRFRYSGYESAAERATRDSMESSVVDALLQNEDLSFSPAATMSLLRIIEDNEAANLPAVANRGTNSIPAGTVLQLPPDP